MAWGGGGGVGFRILGWTNQKFRATVIVYHVNLSSANSGCVMVMNRRGTLPIIVNQVIPCQEEAMCAITSRIRLGCSG